MLVCLSVWPVSVSLKAYVTVCHFQALITKTLTGNAAEAVFPDYWDISLWKPSATYFLSSQQLKERMEPAPPRVSSLNIGSLEEWFDAVRCFCSVKGTGVEAWTKLTEIRLWDRGLQTSEISSFVMVFREAAVVPCCLKWQEVSFVTLKEPLW